ncbi:MAG: hypothetical protein QOJ11_367 [Frankiales bacterium]|nr:hypothetical protein [Frankiales bacterium]
MVRTPGPAVGTVLEDPRRGLLMLWRHRFITDTWGWEIPAGRVDEGETPAAAAAREALEETGWRPGPMRLALQCHPANGLMDQVYHIFHAQGGEYVGPPTDAYESEKVEWIPVSDLRGIIQSGEMKDGLSLVAVLHRLALPPGDHKSG